MTSTVLRDGGPTGRSAAASAAAVPPWIQHGVPPPAPDDPTNPPSPSHQLQPWEPQLLHAPVPCVAHVHLVAPPHGIVGEPAERQGAQGLVPCGPWGLHSLRGGVGAGGKPGEVGSAFLGHLCTLQGSWLTCLPHRLPRCLRTAAADHPAGRAAESAERHGCHPITRSWPTAAPPQSPPSVVPHTPHLLGSATLPSSCPVSISRCSSHCVGVLGCQFWGRETAHREAGAASRSRSSPGNTP